MLKKIFAVTILLLQAISLTLPLSAQERQNTENKAAEAAQKPVGEDENDDPDLPSGIRIDKGEYLRLREEQTAFLRGFPFVKPDSRSSAIFEMMRQENRLRAATGEPDAAPNLAWTPLGPAPIPNGQTTGRTDPVSGRVSAIAVHPTNPNIVYVGTAQGGLYRTLNGGTTWTPLLDGALSLAIGSVAISPSDPTIVYVGTGEAGFSLDSFFGVGIYRITNADSTSPVVSSVLNRDAANADVFTGRSVSKIVVHPTNSNIIFATTVTGTAGLGSAPGAPAPSLGLFRSTNALSASPVFEKIPVSNGGSRPILDAVIEPGNPNHLVLTLVDTNSTGDGGVYVTDNALAAAPTFTRTLTTGAGAELGRAELAINKVGAVVTVFAATGTGSGTIYKSVDGGATFPTSLDNNFCSGQCFYDQAVALDPNDASKVYLAGSPTLPFGRSTNGGTSFTTSATGLHVDSHAIAVAPSSTDTIYFGSDGGMWKSVDAGVSWTSLNNSTFSATQFESIAVHPNDRHYTLGGTQDNGTEYLFPDGVTWTRSVGGDGGFVVIDSNSASPTSLVSYHTFFNSSGSQIGFARSTTTQANGNPIYGNLLGCGGTANGINCADATLFYAPLVLGPNTPTSAGNTVYFGSNKLYRSENQGTTMTPVSQTLLGANERVSAIAVAKQNDNVRVIGSTLGKVYASTAPNSTTMTDVTGAIPARYIGRIAIDPVNADTAYVALGGYGIASHVWKTTNLSAAAPTWTAAASGIPDVPTNGLVIDPVDSQILYAGTDIGVFRTLNGGANWTPFSDGLPRVSVFEITIQPTNRILKIATHGRGIWEMPLNAAPPVRSRADFDGDGKTDFSVFRSGNWFVQRSSVNTSSSIQWGLANDRVAPGDYDGDGRTDFGIYRPNAGNSSTFAVLFSANNTFKIVSWGLSEDVARPGDFDGDGKADISVYRPSENTYYVLPSNGGAAISARIGQSGDTSVVLDYDGDGRTDFAAWRPSTGVWTIRKSSDGTIVNIQFGQIGDRIVPADYDNDNKDDIAVFRDGTWIVLRSSNGAAQFFQFGQTGDVPVPGDYNGDGADDFAVYRGGVWYVSNFPNFSSFSYGLPDDIPVPAGYIP